MGNKDSIIARKLHYSDNEPINDYTTENYLTNRPRLRNIPGNPSPIEKVIFNLNKNSSFHNVQYIIITIFTGVVKKPY